MPARILKIGPDTRLLERIRQGDEGALVELHARHRKPVIALVLRNSGTAADGEEILEEALVILWERVRQGRYEERAAAGTFLFATARNLWLRRLAARRRERPTDPADLPEPVDPDSPLDALIAAEEASLVAAALADLGETCRRILLLFYWEEHSMEEIAAAVGLANAATAKARKHQCRKELERAVRARMTGERA